MAQSKVYVAGFGYDCDAKVVPWFQPPFYDAHREYCMFPSTRARCTLGGKVAYAPFIKGTTRTMRYGFRRRMKRPTVDKQKSLIIPDREVLKGAQKVIKQCVVHFDNCKDSRMCFRVLQDERGLSCHFLLDWDGTIYQTLDLSLKGAQAAGLNNTSIGIEMASWGNAQKFSTYYDKYDPKQLRYRSKEKVKVHGHVFLGWTYTDMQMRALEELARTLRHALPNVAIDYPQETPGKQLYTVMAGGQMQWIRRYSGWCGHYHTTTRKWDPGPFDFKKFIKNIQGGLCFPVYTLGTKAEPGRAPQIPKETTALNDTAVALHKMNEIRSSGGYFPVGPYGQWKLWHGGIHLRLEPGAEVFAPFPGRIVAASQGRANSGVGSTNFVLLKHSINLGAKFGTVQFWSLYYHLGDELRRDAKENPEWMIDKDRTKKLAKLTRLHFHPGQVDLLDIPVAAGARLGRVGMAGPAEHRGPQIHFGIFSSKEIMTRLDSRGAWKVIDGTLSGRFSNRAELDKEIDTNKDKKFSRSELQSFFAMPGERDLARNYVVLFKSEFTGTPKEWLQELQQSPDFKDMKGLSQVIEEQITPSLWWTRRVAKHTGLPPDGVVYHYNPVAFLRKINEQLLLGGKADDQQSSEVKNAKVDKYSDKFSDGDADGVGMITEDELEEEVDSTMDLKRLVKGWKDK